MYLYEQYQREREFAEYLAALMPFVYAKAHTKKRVEISDFMLLYGERRAGDDGDDLGGEMTDSEIGVQVLELQARFGGRLIKKGE